MTPHRLRALYDRVADAPDAIPRLRRFVLNLAVRGKLVAQDAADEPAAELLKRIGKEKARLVKAEEISAMKKAPPSTRPDLTFPLPKHWVPVRLSEILDEIQTGPFGSSLHQSDYLTGGTPVINPASLQDERIVPIDRMAVGPRSLDRLAIFKIRSGDILLARRGEMGRCALVKESESGWLCGTGCLVLRPSKLLYARFLVLLIGAPFSREYLAGSSVGATMQNLNQSILLDLPFDLPPLAEQRRIVAKVEELMDLLGRLEAGRQARERSRDRLTTATLARLTAPQATPASATPTSFALKTLPTLTTRPDQLKHLRQTILNLAVRGKLVEQDAGDEPAVASLRRIGQEKARLIATKILRREKPLPRIREAEAPHDIPGSWLWARIGDVFLFTQYGTSQQAHRTETGVPVLTMGSINDGKIQTGYEKRIPPDSADLPTLYVKDRDLLYNRTNSAELVGKTGLYRGKDDVFSFASYLIRLHPAQEATSPEYLNMAMNAPSFRDTQIVPMIKKQTGQANVSGGALRSMIIPLPPLAEQQRIVAKVDALMALCTQLEASLTTTNTTRQRLLESLLHEALNPAEKREMEAAA